jgi:pimeloyl-ACP methyl ester carboxylesterase
MFASSANYARCNPIMSDMPRQKPLPQVKHRIIGAEVPIHLVELPGDAPPLILLHGIGMDWRVWQATMRRLSPYFHQYAVDLRGHGESGKPDHGYTVAHYAADVEDLIDALHLDRVTLVGSSLGGAIAAAVEAPSDVVSARVLVDPPLTGGPVRDPDMFEDILKLKHQPLDRLAAYLPIHYPGTGQFLARAMAEMWAEAADGVIQDLLADRDTYFALDPALQAIESPTLLIQADPTMGAALSDASAEYALSLLEHGTLARVPGAGHAVHATKPFEFLRLVLDFTGRTSIDR